MRPVWWAFLLTIVLAGCATSEPVPQDRFYQLEPIVPRQPLAQPALGGGLEVDFTQADPLRSGRAVLYSNADQPLRVQRYHYAYWIDQPPRMVQRALLAYLGELAVAERVFSAGERGESNYRLYTRLLRFEQIRDGKSSAVEVALQVTLVASADGKPLVERTYTARQASAGGDMHAVAAAMQQALGEVLQSLGGDLAAVSDTRQ